MVYDGGAPRRPAVAPADDAVDPLAAVQPPSGLAGGRFIDDGDEVGFRRGIYRAAREGYDVFAVDPERAERLSSIAPTETFRVPGPDGPVDRVGFRITPELRTRLTAGEARFRYGPADGEASPGDRWMDFVPEDRAASDGFEYRTNAEGWRQLLPYRDKWGDPANDEGDRGAALARLQEIGSTDWRGAEWDDVLRAHDDVEEVIAQLYFYRPDISMERAAALDADSDARGSDLRFFGGEVRAYMHEREKGEPFGVRADSAPGRWSMLSPQGERGPVTAEIGDAAREAIEAISKRAGAMDLLRGWSRSADARRDRIPAERAPDAAGFVSAVRRAIEGLPDSAFQRDPLALYNTIRKQPNVTGEELDFMDFAARLMAQGSRHRWTRVELLKLVDDHGLRMVRRNNEFDPRLPTRQYEYGKTRAFDGPRIPGPGRYFEERFAFPKRTRGGARVPGGDVDVSHWEEGVWGSIRGSVREVDGYGKGILGEELQRDYYQQIAAGRAETVPARDFRKAQVERDMLRRVQSDALVMVNQIWRSFVDSGASLPNDRAIDAPVLRDAVARGDLGPVETVARAVREHVEARSAVGEPMRGILSDVDGTLYQLNSVVSRNAAAFNEAAATRAATGILPEPPMSDTQSVRMLVRALFTRAAREQADWVAIPTGATNDRIQYNTWASAGHFYDGMARDVLEKVARAIGGDALKVERVVLPTPPLRRGAPVYMVRGITPAMRLKIREGLPMFGAAERMPTSRMSVEDVEGEVRNAWGPVGAALLDSGTIQVVNDPWDLRHVFDDEDIAQIPSWVGAVHDYNTNKTFLFSDRIAPGRARLLVLHEIGVHHGLQEMVGKKRYGALIREAKARVKLARDRIQQAIDAGATDISDRRIDPTDVFWASADARVRKAYESNDPAYGDELLAYASEDAEAAFGSLPEAHPDRTWWQGILDAIRRWMVTSFAPGGAVRKAGEAVLGAVGEAGNLTPRDLHTLAVASLQRVARSRQAEAGPVGAVDGGRVLRYARDRGFEGEDPVLAAKWLDRQGYFSPALEAARRYPQARAKRADMVGWLQNQKGVKKDELNTLFLDEFVAGGEFATRDELLGWLRTHRYETELQLGTVADGSTQWGRYTYLPAVKHMDSDGRFITGLDEDDLVAPAGYWEAIVSPRDFNMPGARWDGSHMNTNGVLAHARGADDVDVAGKPAALIIELQSDMWDLKPKDRVIDMRAVLRQADADVASLREHFGKEAGELWDQAKHFTGASLMRATSEGPPDVLAIDGGTYMRDEVNLLRSGQMMGESKLRVEQLQRMSDLLDAIRKHNTAAERLADDRTRQNGGAFGPDPSDALRAESMRLRGGLSRDRDINAPYRQTWPVKVFTDVVREKIRAGATRIAWSTKEAVNSITGMASYAGDLYDVRVPRYAREWLGVEPQQGVVNSENAGQPRGPMSIDETERMAVVDLVINDSMPPDLYAEDATVGSSDLTDAMGEFLQEQALNDDFFSNVLSGSMALEDEQRLVVRALRSDIESGGLDSVLASTMEGNPRDEGELRLLEQWARDFVERSVNEFRIREGQARGPVRAWYFDVTPEIRERALGERSMFFGPADSGQPPRDLSALLNGGAGGGLGPARIRAAGPDDEASPGAAIDDVIRRASEMSQQRIRDGKIVTVMDGEIEALTQGVQRLPPDDQADALARIGAKYHEDVVEEIRYRAGIDQPVIEGEVAAPAAAPAAKPKRKPRGNADDAVRRAAGEGADYRTGSGGRGPKAAGLGEMIAGNTAALGVGGVAAAVVAHEQGREERRAEYEVYAEEQRKSAAQRGEQDERREEYSAIDEALAAGDWESLPALDPGLLERDDAGRKGRTAYVAELSQIVERFSDVPAEFIQALIARETAYTFDPTIRPITRDGRVLSSAVGYGQFVDSTWASELRRSGARLGVDVEGRSAKDIQGDEALMALREDPRFAALMVGLHTRENVLLLQQRLDRDVTTGEAYLAHFLGADRAVAFIRDVEADLPAQATKRRYAREAASNPHVFMDGSVARSARQIMAEIESEFGNERFHIDEESADDGDGAAAGADE